MSNSKKIWEKEFKDNEYAFDFSNKLILKNEFRTGKEYSWDYDSFDYNDEIETAFIANENLIKAKDKQPIFMFEGNKYISIKNDNFTYSIISPTKIIDIDNPINYDLYLLNKFLNYNNSNYFVFTISYKKLRSKLNDVFISFISDSLKARIDFEFLKTESDEWKNKLSFLIHKEKHNAKEILDVATIFKPLLKLFLIRAKEKFENIFESLIVEEDLMFFNIYIFFDDKSVDNIFENNKINFINYAESLEERILLNENFKTELVDNHLVASSEFLKLYNFNGIKIYGYNYVNTRFDSYYLRETNK